MKKRGCCIRFGGGRRGGVAALLFVFFILPVISSVHADLGPENILILVNSDSATSQYIAKMYREYYPAIQDIQVLELSGLADCSGPSSTAADEIITRDVYNTCIAEPVRQHLTDHNLIQQIMVVVTTAGMPYRIEDTNYADVVYPAGSNYNLVSQNCAQIDAASVESELTCLWYADEFGLDNRMVNPYQGYRVSSVTMFERATPGTKTLLWNKAVTITGTPPKMEGEMLYTWPPIYGTINRSFSAGDMYLTCRLDGPKNQGESAIFAVRKMLERAKRASDPASGVNPLQGVIVIDDCPTKTYDMNRVCNLDGSTNYYTYQPDTKQPPDAPTVLSMDDYTDAFDALTSGAVVDATAINTGMFDAGYGLKIVLDRRAATRTCQDDLGLQETPVFFCCYGKNGDEGSASDYLTNGPDGDSLFDPANGAVFTSIESFNALTMFSDEATVPVAQGKIVDFIAIGGSGAIGHAFEPISSAVVDNVFVVYNLFADGDGDGFADVTFIEAAFSGIPFLSWSEVVIGDPLMRVSYGPGESGAWEQAPGDVNNDGTVNVLDVRAQRRSFGSDMDSDFELYDDLADLNKDGRVNVLDVRVLRMNF